MVLSEVQRDANESFTQLVAGMGWECRSKYLSSDTIRTLRREAGLLHESLNPTGIVICWRRDLVACTVAVEDACSNTIVVRARLVKSGATVNVVVSYYCSPLQAR